MRAQANELAAVKRTLENAQKENERLRQAGGGTGEWEVLWAEVIQREIQKHRMSSDFLQNIFLMQRTVLQWHNGLLKPVRYRRWCVAVWLRFRGLRLAGWLGVLRLYTFILHSSSKSPDMPAVYLPGGFSTSGQPDDDVRPTVFSSSNRKRVGDPVVSGFALVSQWCLVRCQHLNSVVLSGALSSACRRREATHE